MDANKGLKAKDIFLSLSPLAVLIVLLYLTISIFHSDALSGASQVSLLFSSAFCVFVGMVFYKTRWKKIEEMISVNIGKISGPLLILMLIGALSGVWMLSGTVPLMIYYGLKILNPSFFLVCACVICSLVSVLTGSSWTTVATIGVALMGIGKAQGFSDGLIAGAIISGAYFGDKISPLSDTTVIASSSTGTPLFEHIRYMLYTTIPSLVLTLLLFVVIGLNYDVTSGNQIDTYSETLQSTFNLSPWLILIPIITFLLIYFKVPAVIVLFIAVMLGVVFSLIFQRDILLSVSDFDGNIVERLTAGVMRSIYDSTSITTGNAEVDNLVATRGIRGMLDTIWLILCALTFGSYMEACGMIKRITHAIRRFVRTRLQLVSSTVLTGIFLNIATGDQYMSILINGSVFNDIYKKLGYESRLLSRTIEDSTTVTSVLVPWNTCGMTQATVLHVSTITYLPYCFFNILSPLVSIFVAAIGYKIFKRKEEE